MSKATKKFKRDLIPTKCEYPGCGYSFFVARHRIKPGKINGKYIPGNVIGLCPNHHAEADAGAISMYDLFTIVQFRLRNTFNSRDIEDGYHKWDGVGKIPTERLTYVAYTPDGVHRQRASLRRD